MYSRETGGVVSFNISPETNDDIRDIARKLIATGQTSLPLSTPSGTSMMMITTDLDVLSFSVMELEVDGTTVYVGFEKDPKSPV